MFQFKSNYARILNSIYVFPTNDVEYGDKVEFLMMMMEFLDKLQKKPLQKFLKQSLDALRIEPQ